MNSDDMWAHDRIVEFPKLEECSSVRVTIDGITHRALNEDCTGWRTLCGSHRLLMPATRGYFGIAGQIPVRVYTFSASDVDCLCCLPAGG